MVNKREDLWIISAPRKPRSVKESMEVETRSAINRFDKELKSCRLKNGLDRGNLAELQASVLQLTSVTGSLGEVIGR